MSSTDNAVWCQRETGSAFVLNAMLEAEPVQLLEGEAQIRGIESEVMR